MNDKRCPIQIIEEDPIKGGIFGSKWITLLKDINFKNKIYRNVTPFHKNLPLSNEMLLKRLFEGKFEASIESWDIIRNPTREELIRLSNMAKQCGLKINIKTGECIGDLSHIELPI